jgi:hypothetical protein
MLRITIEKVSQDGASPACRAVASMRIAEKRGTGDGGRFMVVAMEAADAAAVIASCIAECEVEATEPGRRAWALLGRAREAILHADWVKL